MALSLATEQRLTRAKLLTLFAKHQTDWTAAAQSAYNYVSESFPDGATIRPDDVSKALVPVFEVEQRLRAHLDAARFTQKYWIKDFTDLVIDRCWETIS